MHSYVGWIATQVRPEVQLTPKSELSKLITQEALEAWRHGYIKLAHTFLDQPNELGDFVRGEEPKKDDYESSMQYEADWHKWKNHKPLYKGEWVLDIVSVKEWVFYRPDLNISITVQRKSSRNAFATHCKEQGISLELDEEYQIQ